MKPVYRIKAKTRPHLTVIEFKPRRSEAIAAEAERLCEFVRDHDITALGIAMTHRDGAITTWFESDGGIFTLRAGIAVLARRVDNAIESQT